MVFRRPFGFIGNLKFFGHINRFASFLFTAAPILRSYSKTGGNSSKIPRNRYLKKVSGIQKQILATICPHAERD